MAASGSPPSEAGGLPRDRDPRPCRRGAAPLAVPSLRYHPRRTAGGGGSRGRDLGEAPPAVAPRRPSSSGLHSLAVKQRRAGCQWSQVTTNHRETASRCSSFIGRAKANATRRDNAQLAIARHPPRCDVVIKSEVGTAPRRRGTPFRRSSVHTRGVPAKARLPYHCDVAIKSSRGVGWYIGSATLARCIDNAPLC
ncbi:hypothetical protein BDY21DRAFT_129858 [Lineolata rhizophorae]|uniref:Uncharacterized protein n=1 Tax=Lineolata rhizophorae TaxID=578093 RepID=A0A6A6NNW7_9PEZI|nr:hypothetical protein BDY21DRAFT_129858 [Lineolata rhizophorae]